MNKFLFSTISLTYFLSAGVVVPDDYFISEDENISYIYSKEYQGILPNIKEYQEKIIKGYEDEYGYEFDDRLYVGLASFKNEVANGFSTQIPFNSQLLYGAGAGYIDYFSFSSWLKTLIIHETAHNFQINPKENSLSKISHKIFGNTPITFLPLLPLFPIPNITDSPFILEGIAVMNESCYGNGGRLFSGYALAELIALAKADKITPSLMYNDTLSFPYGEHFYLIGGFFQQFLVERYGIKRVNSYFKTYAKQPFPFFTNWVFKEQFGEDFESLLAKFVQKVKREHESFKVTEGEVISQSKVFVPFNVGKDEIYTLISDMTSSPRVLRVDKRSKKVDYEDGSWRVGEIFKYKSDYYTQSSSRVSPTKISMGLFNRDGYLLEGTESKVIQGFTSKGKMVYFDVPSSIETPQVYVDGEFYTQSHSSISVHGDDLYYFKQEKERRILYKNRKALFEYVGHYGFVTDISDDIVYFIAPSKDGSSLYSLENGKVKRVIKGDDVIDFKLLNSKEGVVATIGAEGYIYKIVKLSKATSMRPFEFKIENSKELKEIFSEDKDKKPLNFDSYNSLYELKHSSIDQSMGYGSYSGFGVDVNLNFTDPLMQNSLSIPISYDSRRTIIGARYENSSSPLEFGGAVYGVYTNGNLNSNLRDYGVDLYLHYPFLATGYWRGSTTLAYTKAYDNIYREPLTLSVDILNNKEFGISKYPNSFNGLSLFVTEDRDYNIFGASYGWEHDMPWESYIGVKGKYLKSSMVDFAMEKGVEIGNSSSKIESDRGFVDIPTANHTTYADEVKVGEFSLKKVFNGSIYSYSFPVSLQRESLYFKQRLYDIDFTKEINKKYNETVIGVEADLLFLHKIPLPLSFEYLYNPDIIDREQFRVMFGGSF